MEWLEELNVSFNLIGNRGVKYLCQADWPRFSKLTARCVGITAAGFGYFAKIKGKNGRIELITSVRHQTSKLLNELPKYQTESV